MDNIENLLKKIYPKQDIKYLVDKVNDLIEENKSEFRSDDKLDASDVILITYADSITKKGQEGIKTLNKFLKAYTGNLITGIHFLPFYPYTSDDGFSISDYNKIIPSYGNWNDVEDISKNKKIMLDAVINHTSVSNNWFKENKAYYIEYNPKFDCSKVIRPRTTPLFSEIEENKYWTTFSEDQIDLNYNNPDVLFEIIKILMNYVSFGAKLIRLDAVGFIWKESGTTCMHLEQVHDIIKLINIILNKTFGNIYLVTETNVPEKDNLTYFGNGDEAAMIYQFVLPPLLLYTFIEKNSKKFQEWLKHLDKLEIPDGTTYFNFTASHDGIGLRSVEDILEKSEVSKIVDKVKEKNGQVSYMIDDKGIKKPYELNINYFDALSINDNNQLNIDSFLCSQFLMLSLKGVPGIYYNSLVGSRNWVEGYKKSNIKRRINRQKWDIDQLENEIKNNYERSYILRKYLELIKARNNKAFNPYSKQEEIFIDETLVSFLRDDVLVLSNITNDKVVLNGNIRGYDLIRNEEISLFELDPYEYFWLDNYNIQINNE